MTISSPVGTEYHSPIVLWQISACECFRTQRRLVANTSLMNLLTLSSQRGSSGKNIIGALLSCQETAACPTHPSRVGLHCLEIRGRSLFYCRARPWALAAFEQGEQSANTLMPPVMTLHANVVEEWVRKTQGQFNQNLRLGKRVLSCLARWSLMLQHVEHPSCERALSTSSRVMQFLGLAVQILAVDKHQSGKSMKGNSKMWKIIKVLKSIETLSGLQKGQALCL